MKETRLCMGMPISVEIVSGDSLQDAIGEVFSYFAAVDARFSTYRSESEIMQINRGEIEEKERSDEMREVFALAEQTKKESDGYFDITQADGHIDPSGVVKGWAIQNATTLLHSRGHEDFYIDAGGDIQTSGHDEEGKEWSVGIRHPFQPNEIVKVIYPRGKGVATSGTYVRGQHIYNPHQPKEPIIEIASLTVIGPNVCDADRFATAAFAMGNQGIHFIEGLKGYEGYSIDMHGVATMTEGFEAYTIL